MVRGGANGSLSTDDSNLSILTIQHGGLGFAEDPAVDVLNEHNKTILRLDPSWITLRAGTETFEQAVLRDLSESSVRGLRGLQFLLSPNSPIGEDSGGNMETMWLADQM